MYPITDEMKTLFVQKQRQTAEISVELKDGSTVDDFKITEADIVLGSFSIDRYSATGENIEIGSAVASEIKFTLDNSKGKFDGVSLGGAKLFVRLGIKDWSDDEALMHYMDCGYFTVDENPKPLNYISVAALDNMMRFDRTVNWSNFSFPMSIEKIVSACCADCDVTLSSSVDFSALPNGTYIVQNKPTTTDITYRQLIQWVAEITGTCAFIDWNGRLRFKWSETTNVGLDTSNRYNSSVDESITITGVQITESETEFYLNGEEGVVFNIEGNELIQNNQTEVAANLGAVLNGFTYTPFECSCFPMPYLYPLDIISFTDIKGNTFNTMISAHVYTLNGTSSLKAVGESLQQKNYSVSNPFTKREALIIKNLKKEMETNMSRVEQETVEMNKVLANALGLYDTTVKHDDGSVTYYYHSKPTLEECSEGDLIFCLNAGGFGVCTTGWNDGDIVYTDGYNAVDGKAIFQYLVTKHLTADLITAGKLQSENGNTYFDLNKGVIYSQGTETPVEDGEEIATNVAQFSNGGLILTDELNGMLASITTRLFSLVIKEEGTQEQEDYIYTEPTNAEWDKILTEIFGITLDYDKTKYSTYWESLSGVAGTSLKLMYTTAYKTYDYAKWALVNKKGLHIKSTTDDGATTNESLFTGSKILLKKSNTEDGTVTAKARYTAEGISSSVPFFIEKLSRYKRKLTSEDNMDDIVEEGVYFYQTQSLPDNCYYSNAGVVEVIHADSDATRIIQRNTRYGVAGETAFRTKFDGKWNKWDGSHYIPGESISLEIYTSGYVTASGTAVFFVIPLSKGVADGTVVSVSSGSVGLVCRQNGKYTHGSASGSYVKPTYSAWLLDGQTIQIKATLSDTTNVTNNDTIGVQWDGTITFS